MADEAASGETLLKVPDVARMLGVSESWVRKRTSEKQIKHHRFGGNIRYRLEDIKEYLADHIQDVVE